MKILIYNKKSDNTVTRVESRDKYSKKTDAELDKAISEYNNNSDNNIRIKYIEVPENLSEAINFLLGEAKYKTTWTIQDLIERMDDFCGTLSSIEDDISHCRWSVEKLVEEGREIIKNNNDEEE